MKEGTNRAIAINSTILYGKMVVNTLCALLTTRFALQALGVVDYGLYAVLGGIISFISIFNTIMVSTSNRFIAVALGKGDMEMVNKQFNVNLFIHLLIALLALFAAYPIGEWYIPRYVNYDGPISNAMMVYVISIAGCIVSFVGVPYNGLLMAKEKFIVFSLVDVISHIIRLVIAWILVYYFEQKLLVYTLTMAIMTALPTVVFIVYCSRHYPEMVKLRRVRDRSMYKNVFGFSAWVAVGAVAQVGKNQGAALVVNAFFNTVMNTAMGVAASINTYVGIFAQNVIQPMAPQITKSYAAGNLQRTDELLIMSVKYSFMLTFLVGALLLVEPEWLLDIWLDEVPPYASTFLVLLVIDSLVCSLNGGVSNLIFASGKIQLYQMFTSILRILSIVVAYFVLRSGTPAYYIIITYIFFSILTFFAIQYSLRHTLNYDNGKLWRHSYIPSLITVLLFLPAFLLPDSIHPAVRLAVAFSYLCVLEWFVCLTRNERDRLLCFIKRIISRKNHKE